MSDHTNATTALRVPAGCEYCGAWPPHELPRCPRVAAIDFDEAGRILRVEFHPPPIPA